LEHFNPHSFRNTLVLLGMERGRTPAELNAWSLRLGHDMLCTIREAGVQ
jgi:hypothetical protein